MREVSIKEARQKLRALLDEVGGGAEVVLLRRGKPVARLVPVAATAADDNRLPRLGHFRDSIHLRGGSLGEALAAVRSEERY